MKQEKILHIFEVENRLNKIQDVDVLLEEILTEARNIVNADAGSIYVCEDKWLKIRYAQNDTQKKQLGPGQKLPFVYFSFEQNVKSVSGYSAISGELVNIADVYAIPADKPYLFNADPDVKSGYRTKSTLTVPLITADSKVLGVLQIINALDEAGNIIAFDDDAEFYIKHFAVAATQALERAYLTRSMILRMIQMAGFRDPKETGAHVNRVANYSVEIYDLWAVRNNIDYSYAQRFRDNLMIASMLHDVGKVAISDLILKKPAKLDQTEYAVMQQHTYMGALLFSKVESAIDSIARDVALRHHERWDGTGYPGYIDLATGEPLEIDPQTGKNRGLKGEDVPLVARIVALADVFDALSSKRAYKEPWCEEDVVAEILSQAGKQFDPEIVTIFMDILPRLRSIQAAWKEED